MNRKTFFQIVMGAATTFALQANTFSLQAATFSSHAAGPTRQVLQAEGLTFNSFFGYQVAVSGKWMAVAAPHFKAGQVVAAGAVYVYQKGSGSHWEAHSILQAPAPGFNDQYGMALALQGDTLLVGAPQATASGAVYAYRYGNGEWRLSGTLQPEAGDVRFGSGLALDRDRVAVASGLGQSSVYVFGRRQEVWSVERRIPAAEAEVDGGSFGASLAMEGETLVIGAPRAIFRNAQEGAVAVYSGRTGTWIRQATLRPHVAPATYLFGWSVALQGDRLVVGAPLGDLGGTVFAYNRAGGAWSPAFLLTATEGGATPGTNFGQAVAMQGTTLAVGAPAAAVGTVSFFTVTGDSFVLASQMAASSGGNQALFGQQIVLPDNNQVMIASPGWSSEATAFLGSVEVFSR